MKRFPKPKIFVHFIILIFFGSSQTLWALTEAAQKIFEDSNAAVYQIRIVDLNSGEKSSIGSGFRFSEEGFFATNYHVVAEVISTPERYRIEYRKNNGEHGDLIIKTIDVPHDLAILQGEANQDKPYLELIATTLSKGNKVFPMGNPLDLGMTIIEGTYNGLIGEEFYQQVLLSASLNGGMSGGPAFDSTGKVIGVNVAIEGNDLSYLVPVEYLVDLVSKIKKETPNWEEAIQEQFLERYRRIIDSFLKGDWSSEVFGSLKVPKNISPSFFKCWGESKPEDKKENQFFEYSYKWCKNENSVYLSSDFNTGTIGYLFYWLTSDTLNSLEFSQLYSKEFAKSYFYPSVKKKEVTKFKCKNKFVEFADHN
jgi:serine protease Do